jgi:hypothetical protein
MKRFVRDYVIAVSWYVGLVVMGLVITLTTSSAIGYLPYSDRPGPGWTEPSFSFGQVWFYLQWSTWLLVPSAIYGTVVFVYLRVLRVLDAPSALIRVVGATSAGLMAFVISAGVGWYISMAAFPVFVAMGLGGWWGAVLCPRYLGPKPLPRPSWVRWTANSVVLLAGAGAFFSTFLAPHYAQNLSLSILRVTPSEERSPGRVWSPLEPREVVILDSILPNEHFEQGTLASSSTGNSDINARMLIVVTGPLAAEVRLRQPKGVSVVYIQRGARWDMIPADATTLSQVITLGPGSKPNEMIWTFPTSGPSTITWGLHRTEKHEAPGSAR